MTNAQMDKLLKQRMELSNRIMDLALYIGRNPMADDFDSRELEWKKLKAEYDQLPSLLDENTVGRQRIGVTKKQSLTLRDETWEWLDEQVANGHAGSRSEFLRDIVEFARTGTK